MNSSELYAFWRVFWEVFSYTIWWRLRRQCNIGHDVLQYSVQKMWQWMEDNTQWRRDGLTETAKKRGSWKLRDVKNVNRLNAQVFTLAPDSRGQEWSGRSSSASQRSFCAMIRLGWHPHRIHSSPCQGNRSGSETKLLTFTSRNNPEEGFVAL